MPRGDRTGPAGMGPMTGRAAGYCAGYAVPGVANPMGGGFGAGWGMGLGFRGGRGGRWGARGWGAGLFTRPYATPIPAQQEKEALQQQAEFLAQTLADIQARLAQLEQDKPEK